MEKNVKIRVKDLDFYYGDFQALKKINIDVNSNQITALIGPSGWGKSTFLRHLACQFFSLGGTVIVIELS